MVMSGTTLGIIAGGGELPIAIAEAALGEGRPVFLLGLQGLARPENLRNFPHAFVSLGEVGKALRLLRDAGCSEVTLAGKVPRPQFREIKLDARAALLLPKVLAAALRGDDALLRAVVSIFEKEGLRVIGSAEAARDLLAPAGHLGEYEPTEQEFEDIAKAREVVRAMGTLDIGQAAVVCEGLVLAVEAAEGTDEMLRRVADLPETVRGTSEHRRGVLVKAPKPHQERRVDLPVVGIATVELAARAGLSGIAVEAGSALIVTRRMVAEAADYHEIFVYGFEAPKAQ